MEYKYLKESNPWWDNHYWYESDIHLTNLNKQSVKWDYKIIKSFEDGIYSLRGPRQVGKTSWIKQQIKILSEKINSRNIFFYSCDNINKKELEEILNVFLEFSDEGKKFIFLDEIPFVENWEFVIKHFYDAGKLNKCFVLVSGSNSLDLKRSSERLPGRGDSGKRHFCMQPLSFKEFLEATNYDVPRKEVELNLDLKKIQSKLDDYLLTGGFLKIINEFYETKKISDASYDVYIKWIIGDIAKIELKERYCKQILRRVLETYTSEISWSSLKSNTDIDTHNTAAKYVEALEEMFILQIIYKMRYDKKIPDYPKSKKIYFSDPFILCACLKWVFSYENNFELSKNFLSENKDKICEGLILNNLVKLLNKKTGSNVFNYGDVIYYWTNKQKTKEVDFVYKNLGIELKYQNSIKKSDYNALKEFHKYFLVTKKDFFKNTLPLEIFLILLEKNIDALK